MEMSSLVPWSRRGELTSFRQEMDRFFDRFFEGWPLRPSGEEGEWAPAVDVSETAKEVIVKAELPGMDPKDIDVSVHSDVLTLRGERKKEHEEKGEDFHRIERSYGAFSRSIRLPGEVDVAKVKATYKDGVLKIYLPKTKEAAVKKIEVKAAKISGPGKGRVKCYEGGPGSPLVASTRRHKRNEAGLPKRLTMGKHNPKGLWEVLERLLLHLINVVEIQHAG
ncbi:Hsp20/alpha crystallin family protein [bacterium]|nr:Hsp20/alpha crystallin family protein [bacterium]